MKLHTNFRDYYDHAIGYGIDEKVHYNRRTAEAEISVRSKADFPPDWINSHLLGFCGKIYPVVRLDKLNVAIHDSDHDEESRIVDTFYAYSFAEAREKADEWDELCDGFWCSNDAERLKIKQFYQDWSFDDDQVFLEHKTPCRILRLDKNQKTGLINPPLKDYGFDRIKDGFAAFQDISMYLANILVEQKETAAVEDKFRIEQHGFDLKKSFRKEKQQ